MNKLQILYDHIANLPDELWFFDLFYKGKTDCGTIGCALGHATEIFPTIFSWKKTIGDDYYELVVQGDQDKSEVYNAATFFDMDSNHAYYLFTRVGTPDKIVITKQMFLHNLKNYIETGIVIRYRELVDV